MKEHVERRTKRLLWKTFLRMTGPAETRPAFQGSLKSMVILAQEKLGDAILLTPLIGMLKKSIPGVQIDVVTYGSNFGFFELDPNVSKVHRGKRDYVKYFSTLKARRYDLLFSTKDHPSFTFLYQSRIIPARYRVGILHPMHHGFFNHLIPVDFHRHIIEKNCSLLDHLGVPYRHSDLRPYLPEGPVRPLIRTFSESLAGRSAIGVNLSAGSADREWPLANWERLVSRINRPVVVFAMPGRFADKKRLESEYPNVLPAPETETLYEAGEMLRRLKLLVSPDTSLIHAASCFDIPVAGLYRSDLVHLQRFYPYLVPHRLTVSKTRRVADIPVDEALKAVRELLNG
jgi:ADP-heptose:LPS heptosyltransferase